MVEAAFEKSSVESSRVLELMALAAASMKLRGYDLQMPPNVDVVVPGQIGLSFDEQGKLIWVEV
jgi:hypothetical protein